MIETDPREGTRWMTEKAVATCDVVPASLSVVLFRAGGLHWQASDTDNHPRVNHDWKDILLCNFISIAKYITILVCCLLSLHGQNMNMCTSWTYDMNTLLIQRGYYLARIAYYALILGKHDLLHHSQTSYNLVPCFIASFGGGNA